MWSLTIVLIVFLIFVESGRIPRNLFNMDPQETMLDDRRNKNGVQQDDSEESEDYQLGNPSSEDKTKFVDEYNKTPCGALYLSGNYNSVQSLLRKYRYDSHGSLIPTSVKYYLKSLDPDSGKPHLVQLHDESFSTSGGFIKYYKAVPPVPQYYSPL